MNFLQGLFPAAARNDIPKLENYNDSIYVFYAPPGPAKGIVIFFHDIHWKEYEEPHVQSWMSSSTPSICWPKDWLGERYPETKILSARYDAGMWKSDTTGHMDLHQLAENLRHDVLEIYAESCAAVFLVGHGLGGLVIKKMIQIMQEECVKLSKRAGAGEESKKLDCFLKNVKGLFYYATPFLGCELASSMKYFPRRGKVLDPLELLSIEACRLNDWFRNWRQDNHCRATAIFATLPTKVALWYGNWSTHIVQEAAARSDVDKFYSSNSDHFTVCKPHDDTDSSFHMLTELIGSQMSSIPGPSQTISMSLKLLNTKLITKNVDAECEEILKNFLDDLAKLSMGHGMILQINDIRKLENSPEMLRCLRGSLKNAGLELTHMDDSLEYWEPADDEDESGDIQED